MSIRGALEHALAFAHQRGKRMRFREMGVLVLGMVSGVVSPAWSQSVAVPTPQRALLAISKVEHSLAIVDPANLQILARMPVGADPHEVVASSDGTTAYVSNTGSGLAHEINVLDLVGQKALPTWLGRQVLAFRGRATQGVVGVRGLLWRFARPGLSRLVVEHGFG